MVVPDVVRVVRGNQTVSERPIQRISAPRGLATCAGPVSRTSSSSWHMEHVFAFSNDPRNNDVMGNILPACAPCNQTKGNRNLLALVGGDLSINSNLPFQDMSLEDRVKNHLRLAVRVKRDPSKQSDGEVDSWVEQLGEHAAKELSRVDGVNLQHAEWIGGGGQAPTYKATWRDDPVCIKRWHRFTDRELSVMARVSHPNIVEYYGWISQEGAVPAYIVMELLDHTLDSEEGREEFFSEEHFLNHLEGLTSALEYLAQYGVVHRDIKPSNIMYSRKHRCFKLVDFGLSRTVEPDQATPCTRGVGTPSFRPPESYHEYPAKGDVYMLARTLECIQSRNPLSENLARFLDEFIAKCLQSKPAACPDARQLLQYIKAIHAGNSLVYVKHLPGSGCYHKRKGCHGANEPIPLREAQKSREGCKKCHKDGRESVNCAGGCGETLEPNHVGVKCPQSHHFCSECSLRLCSLILEEPDRHLPPKCPTCRCELRPEVIEAQLDSDKLLKFGQHMLQYVWQFTVLDDDEELVRCPFCTNMVIKQKGTGDINFFECSQCKETSCLVCKHSLPRFTSRMVGEWEDVDNDVEDIILDNSSSPATHFRYHMRCLRLAPLRERFDKVLRIGAERNCPSCGQGGMKDEECTHMACECGVQWCYVCGMAEGGCNKAGSGTGLFGHNEDWASDSTRCPLYLSSIHKVDNSWPSDEHAAVERLHRHLVLRALRSFCEEEGDQSMRALQAHFSAISSCGFTLEEIRAAETTLFRRPLRR